MKIGIRDLSFGYTASLLFDNLSAELDGGKNGRPLVILGTSGCGKTTLLKLLGGLLKPRSGRVLFSDGSATGFADSAGLSARTSFMFQESRLLPWLTVEQNICLPLEKDFGKKEARERARHFLSLVFLEEKATAFPRQLSGGQAQRVSMARAFAWPSAALFMDEPFQSLDIPLRMNLMEICLSLNGLENHGGNRLLVAVTHDPREAIYMGGRIVILGAAGQGIVFDRNIDLSAEDRAYGSSTAGVLEREMLGYLAG